MIIAKNKEKKRDIYIWLYIILPGGTIFWVKHLQLFRILEKGQVMTMPKKLRKTGHWF